MANQKLRRGRHEAGRVRASIFKPVNPYPWLPWPEALVKLELQRRQLIFSNRYFNPAWSPLLAANMPDYAPEFTFPYDKVAIILIGNFLGNVPGIIDRNALADAILRSEGWQVVVWIESDIVRLGAGAMLDRDLPKLASSLHRGAELQSPYGLPTFMQRLKQAAAGKRKLIIKSRTQQRKKNGRSRSRRNRTRRY